MPEFLNLTPPVEALDLFMKTWTGPASIKVEHVATESALGRVLAQDIRAPHPLPPFARSTVDGYAVRAEDTHGATPSLPAYLELAGEVLMGSKTELMLGSSQTAIVHTGGMIPVGADAVIMLEDTQQVQDAEVEIHKAVAVGENILAEGEDVKAGEVVLRSGTALRPQEIGGLMALGYTKIDVAVRPRVGILSSGDEVVPPGVEPNPGQVRDINSYTLAALVERAGGTPVRRGIIPDDRAELETAARTSFEEDDIVLITAGSSVSARDITVEILADLGEPGVLTHGLAIKPGKPTILGLAKQKPLIGLPGNPVSALVVGGLIIPPILRRYLGMDGEHWYPQVPARLSVNIASQSGREDYQPVRLIHSEGGLLAEPVYGRSNLIFTLVRADGLVLVPAAANGLPEGEEVLVRLF
jgi:molybdopterin molybdotransferase